MVSSSLVLLVFYFMGASRAAALIGEQGCIHDSISRVRVVRGSNSNLTSFQLKTPKKMRNEVILDGRTDGTTDRPTDIQSRVHATKKSWRMGRFSVCTVASVHSPSQPGLKPSQPGLAGMASGLARWPWGGTDKHEQINVQTENLSILQDFAPIRTAAQKAKKAIYKSDMYRWAGAVMLWR